jgi:hypothetical protein
VVLNLSGLVVLLLSLFELDGVDLNAQRLHVQLAIEMKDVPVVYVAPLGLLVQHLLLYNLVSTYTTPNNVSSPSLSLSRSLSGSHSCSRSPCFCLSHALPLARALAASLCDSKSLFYLPVSLL